MKNIIVTGCSSGIGLAVASVFKKAGYRVFASARNEKDLMMLTNNGYESFYLELNSKDSIEKAVKALNAKTSGNISGLVNNAGVSIISAVEDLNIEQMQRQFQTNVFGPIYFTNLLLDSLKKERSGHIFFISSINGRVTFPYMGAYCASKYALESFADALRREYLKEGLKVTIVEPGLFKTKSVDNSRKIFDEYEELKKSKYLYIYKKIYEDFYSKIDKFNDRSVDIIAKTILAIFKSSKYKKRVIVPFRAHIFELFVRFCPLMLQDKIINLRFNYKHIDDDRSKIQENK